MDVFGERGGIGRYGRAALPDSTYMYIGVSIRDNFMSLAGETYYCGSTQSHYSWLI